MAVFWMEGITYVQSKVKVLLYEILLQKKIISVITGSGMPFLDINMVSVTLIITENFIIALFIK